MDRSATDKPARLMSLPTALLAVLGLVSAVALAQPPVRTKVPSTLVGRWLAEDIGGGGVIDRLQSTLAIREEGSAGGNTGCNTFGGLASVEGSNITFGQIVTTLIACDGAIGDQERKFLGALSGTRRFEINTLERKLVLLGADGKVTMRLSRMAP